MFRVNLFSRKFMALVALASLCCWAAVSLAADVTASRTNQGQQGYAYTQTATVVGKEGVLYINLPTELTHHLVYLTSNATRTSGGWEFAIKLPNGVYSTLAPNTNATSTDGYHSNGVWKFTDMSMDSLRVTAAGAPTRRGT
jgi:hypothetical protein